MTERPASEGELRQIRATVARLRAGIMALVCGTVSGTGLALATLWLVVRGGDEVGPHLGLLGQYFPGYTVTWWGSLLGFFYGALTGGIAGWTTAWLYNRLVHLRSRR